MNAYLSEITKAIKQLHGCDATHTGTVPVKEVFRGKVAWEGEVEVFTVTGHPKAKKCYAWGYPNGKGGWVITAVLEIPPVVSPETAVKVAIAAAARAAQKE